MTAETLRIRVPLFMLIPMASCAAAAVLVGPPRMTGRAICRTGMMVEREGRRRVRECSGSR